MIVVLVAMFDDGKTAFKIAHLLYKSQKSVNFAYSYEHKGYLPEIRYRHSDLSWWGRSCCFEGRRRVGLAGQNLRRPLRCEQTRWSEVEAGSASHET